LPKVVINTKEAAEDAERFGGLLEQNGFQVQVVQDRRFAFGQTSAQELTDLLRGASAVVAGATPYAADVLQNLPDLRVIARTGVGFDKIDIAAATDNNVVVTITPNSNYEAVAEHAMMLIFAMAKSVVRVDKNTRLGLWPNSPNKPIRGSVLGIVGLGRIGKSLAVRAQAMKMEILAAEAMPDYAFIENHNIELVDMRMLFQRADYISLHCPLTDETRGLISKETLALMKTEASVINTARGGLVVETDLVNALKAGTIAGAGLDVFEREPTLPDDPFYGLDNVILSPHIAGSDHLSRQAMGIEAANCIIDLSKGRWPGSAVVNGELKEKWRWESTNE